MSKNTSPKCAVVLPGLTRTFEKNFQSLTRTLLAEFDCDYYIHAWDVKGFKYLEQKQIVNSRNVVYPSVKEYDRSEFVDVDLLRNCYHPKSIIIEKLHTKEAEVLELANRLHSLAQNFSTKVCRNFLLQHYSINQAFMSIDGFEKYDYICRARFDVRYYLSLKQINCLNLLENKIVTPSKQKQNYTYFPHVHNKYLMDDTFAIGKPQLMSVYCSFYNSIQSKKMYDIIKSTQCIGPGFLLATFLNEINSINYCRIDIPYDIINS